MPDAVVDLIELAVGLACGALAVGAWRRGLRAIAVVAGAAALAAVGHAVWSLAS